MTAKIHIFNVNHGDSAVVELANNGTTHWLVVDSNRVKRGRNTIVPAYEFLKARNVNTVEAVVLTHFHGDHYNGLEQILNNLTVNRLYIPPMFSEKNEKFNEQVGKVKEKVRELISRSSEEEIGQRASSLAHILHFIVVNEPKVISAEGPENVLRVPGFPDPVGKIYLPLKRMKGQLRQLIDSGDFELDSFKGMNESSIVFSLEFQQRRFLFGADSTLDQWGEHRRQLGRGGVSNLSITDLKIPHHGSNHNNDAELFNYLYRPGVGNIAVVSANGKSHPDDEFFELVDKHELKPYCTNLARQCMGANVTSISGLTRIDPKFRNFISAYDIEDLPIACQGDITVEVDNLNSTVFTSEGNVCPYRFGQAVNIRKLI